MKNLSHDEIEENLINVVQTTANDMEIAVDICADSIPSGMGLTSHALVAAMCRLEVELDIEIPPNCYIFVDDAMRMLSIREASEKLYNILKKNK